MEELLDKLLVLDYIAEFCKPRNLQGLDKFYFLVPSQNPNQQFYYFALLFTWLLNVSGQSCEAPGQFDDPNASSASMISELKKANIPFEYGPLKLKQGYGEAVIYALTSLCDKALKSMGISFQKPIHKNDDYLEEAEVDNDAEVTTDQIIEELVDDGEEDESFAHFTEKEKPVSAPVVTIDPSVWKLEVERVTPLLKVSLVNDIRDWRIHLEQMNHHRSVISHYYSETLDLLERTTMDIEKALEKIASREKYINTQFQMQTEEYKAIQNATSDLKQQYNHCNSKINGLTNELSAVSEQLDSCKTKMDEIGTGMTDSKPLVLIKQAVQRLKSEIKQMDLRIGIIEHTLMQAKLTTKGQFDPLAPLLFA